MPPVYIFIRHGEAKHNVSARKHGPVAYTLKENEDAPLTDEGHRQTFEAGKQIANYIGDREVILISSPLTRTIQTAENLACSLNVVKKQMDDLLIERLGGGHVCNNRKSVDDLFTQFPGWDIQYIQDPPEMPLEREDIFMVSERMKRFWIWTQDQYKHTSKCILVVSHQESLQALFGRDFKNAEFLVYN